MNSVGKRVKGLRIGKNLTQQQVSDILKVDRANYSKYESGKLEFNNDMLIALAGLFEVTTDYLLGLADI